jgi:hypothetical protein
MGQDIRRERELFPDSTDAGEDASEAMRNLA